MGLRFILIGCGRIGIRHAYLIPEFGDLVGVCDPDPARLKDMMERTGSNFQHPGIYRLFPDELQGDRAEPPSLDETLKSIDIIDMIYRHSPLLPFMEDPR